MISEVAIARQAGAVADEAVAQDGDAAGEGGAAVSMILEYLKGWDAGSRGAAES